MGDCHLIILCLPVRTYAFLPFLSNRGKRGERREKEGGGEGKEEGERGGIKEGRELPSWLRGSKSD